MPCIMQDDRGRLNSPFPWLVTAGALRNSSWFDIKHWMVTILRSSLRLPMLFLSLTPGDRRFPDFGPTPRTSSRLWEI